MRELQKQLRNPSCYIKIVRIVEEITHIARDINDDLGQIKQQEGIDA